ncbi:hypothetical protein D3C86_1080050 [compost metagenome]
MSSQRGSDPQRDTQALRRPNGTASFDSFASSAAASDALSATETPTQRAALAEAIAEAEPLLATLLPRITAIARADAANAPNRPSFDELFEGASEGERAFTLQLARILSEHPEAARRARIACQQFQQAEQDLAIAKAAHAQLVASQLDAGPVAGFSVGKFRGTLYPLYNLAMTFEGIPLLESLFPRTRGPAATRPLNMLGAPPKTQELKPTAPAPEAPPLSTMQRFGDWLVKVLGGAPRPENH